MQNIGVNIKKGKIVFIIILILHFFIILFYCLGYSLYQVVADYKDDNSLYCK